MQRQLRLGDILDDYCPRERRVTNHAVVAMVGPDVKQTRCSTCDTEHEYKQARVPRQRRKSETPAALYAQVLAGGPKRAPTLHDHGTDPGNTGSVVKAGVVVDVVDVIEEIEPAELADALQPSSIASSAGDPIASPNGNDRREEGAGDAGDAGDHDERTDEDEDEERGVEDEGPVHRPLIRASLPRVEGQAPPARQMPDFTIRQPGGRPNRFRPRHQRGPGGSGQMFQGNRSSNTGGGSSRGGGMPRPGGGGNRPPMMKRHGGGGRKRSK